MFGVNKIDKLRKQLERAKEDVLDEKTGVFNRLDADPTNLLLKDREAFLTGVEVGLLKAQRLIDKVYGEGK